MNEQRFLNLQPKGGIRVILGFEKRFNELAKVFESAAQERDQSYPRVLEENY